MDTVDPEPLLPFYSVNDASFSLAISSSELILAGEYEITTVSEIVSYNVGGTVVAVDNLSDITSLPESDFSKVINVKLIDPCTESNYLIPQFDDDQHTVRLHSIIGNGLYTYTYLDYKDFVST